jgi:ABC-type transport system involved in multi-copper enzyme maturation permease subunit
MCLTLPILAIVRVFGGVPWDFLLRSFCVTMTAIIFAGLVSLNISIHNKHAYSVIISSIVLLLALYVLLPLVTGWTAHEYFHVSENTVLEWVVVTNPPMMMTLLLEEMFSPHGIMPFSTSIWRFNCLFMLGCSAVLLVRAVIVVRKKALRQACGQLDAGPKKPSARKAARQAKIRHVKGKPLIWKELRRRAFNMGRVRKAVALFLLIGVLLTSYYIFAVEHDLEDMDTQVFYCMIFMMLGIFCTAVLAATAISSEKNSRTWPALLSTLITNKQIVLGKMLGIFRRSFPVWTLLAAHVVAFVFARKYIHPVAIFQIPIVVIPAIVLATSSGLFFSNRLKHTTSAVIANLAFCGCLWAGIPLIAGFLSILAHDDALIELAASVNPFCHMVIILEETAGKANAAKHLFQFTYDWPSGKLAFAPTTIILIMIAVGSLVVSAIFLATTANSLRRKVF